MLESITATDQGQLPSSVYHCFFQVYFTQFFVFSANMFATGLKYYVIDFFQIRIRISLFSGTKPIYMQGTHVKQVVNMNMHYIQDKQKSY